ncbi:hypothetical protein QR685DRAFT_608102 [Neurospora intermedia]|uniref:Secreted protein n=1 Tax=Neurospora intermedia TaxID=5142 RepID=A0ABR3D7X6_NEUIN
MPLVLLFLLILPRACLPACLPACSSPGLHYIVQWMYIGQCSSHFGYLVSLENSQSKPNTYVLNRIATAAAANEVSGQGTTQICEHLSFQRGLPRTRRSLRGM